MLQKNSLCIDDMVLFFVVVHTHMKIIYIYKLVRGELGVFQIVTGSLSMPPDLVMFAPLINFDA